MITAAACLATAIYFEGRSEPVDAQLAIAEVVINRMHHPEYPGTICEVVKQDKGPKAHDCQFSFYCDGKSDKPREEPAWRLAQEIAAQALSGDVLGHRATHYHTKAAKPVWRHDLIQVGVIGEHIFYSDGRCILAMGCSLRPKARPET